MNLNELLHDLGVADFAAPTPTPPNLTLTQFRFVAEELRQQTYANTTANDPQRALIDSVLNLLLSGTEEEQVEKLATISALHCGLCALNESYDDLSAKATMFLIGNLVPKAVEEGVL